LLKSKAPETTPPDRAIARTIGDGSREVKSQRAEYHRSAAIYRKINGSAGKIVGAAICAGYEAA
jgi:hypothetical protein